MDINYLLIMIIFVIFWSFTLQRLTNSNSMVDEKFQRIFASWKIGTFRVPRSSFAARDLEPLKIVIPVNTTWKWPIIYQLFLKYFVVVCRYKFFELIIEFISYNCKIFINFSFYKSHFYASNVFPQFLLEFLVEL